MSAFFAATVELGVSNQVTTFTFSEFGRTIRINGDGSDHGWGNHNLIMGGAVQGGRFWGTYPPVQVGLPNSTSRSSASRATSAAPSCPRSRWINTATRWPAGSACQTPTRATYSSTSTASRRGSSGSSDSRSGFATETQRHRESQSVCNILWAVTLWRLGHSANQMEIFSFRLSMPSLCLCVSVAIIRKGFIHAPSYKLVGVMPLVLVARDRR